MTGLVVLEAGSLRVHVLPASGGSVARFDRVVAGECESLFRGTDNPDARALDCGLFPLVPFCNRIRGGSFECDGRTVRLAPNMPPDPSPLHGQGWQAQWEVSARTQGAVDLHYRHEAGEWPWTYEASHAISLDPSGLSIRLACRNLADEPMPCGLGLHPYFECGPETRLDTHVEGAFTIDENVLPVERVPATGRYDLHDRVICGQDLDNGFDGWNGEATIRRPGRASLRMRSPDAVYFQVYSPTAGKVFVAEPVQHENCALNAPQEDWTKLGLAILPRGAERVLNVRFDILGQPNPAT